MEINLFDDGATLRFEHILIYPYPDMHRLWVRIWLPALLDDTSPNVELRLINPDGSENNSLVLLAQTDTKLNNTFHLKDPIPDGRYRMIAELSVGFNAEAKVVDHQEFDLTLEFRDPESGQRGFGVGLDEWFADETGESQ
jgi:hypothetical protein